MGQVDHGTIRDRPLTFHWRSKPGWTEQLSLPPAASIRRREAQASILLEAALAAAGGWPGVSYSRRRQFYVHGRRYHGTAFTYATVVQTIDELASHGLLENRIAPARGPCGLQSTFRATDLLLGGIPCDVVSHAEHVVHELIVLRDSNKQPAPYRDTARTDRMRRALLEVNEGIGALQIDLDGQHLNGWGVVMVDGVILFPTMRTLYRVFNGDFSHGGRIYGPFWQQAPKGVREKLLIGGEPVVELDYPQLHPRLLYALAGRELVGDAYTLDEWDRPLCKRAFNILLNASTYGSALGAIAHELSGDGAMRKARQLIAEIKLRHSPVSQYFHSGIGLQLQCIDADLAEAVIRRLLKQGIVTLPVHDSFITSARHRCELEEAMDDAFARALPFG